MPYFLLFLLLPLVEIRVFALVAGVMGVWGALGLMMISTFVGAALLREQGVQMLFALQTGTPPRRAVFDSFCIAVAGFLFILPGFVSDIFAILLLLPLVRGQVQSQYYARKGPAPDGDVIEGDYERVEEE